MMESAAWSPGFKASGRGVYDLTNRLLPSLRLVRMSRDGNVGFRKVAVPSSQLMKSAPASAFRPVFSIFYALFLMGVFLTAGLSAQTPSLRMSLSPEGLGVGSCGELLIEIENESEGVVDQLAFRLDFPEGVALAEPALIASDCEGDLSVLAEGPSVVLANGRLNPNTSCEIRLAVELQSESPVVLSTSSLASSIGSSPAAAVTLQAPVGGPSLGFAKSFGANPIQLGGTTTLTYTIENQSDQQAGGITFIDELSSGLVVAPSPNVQSSCDPAVVTAVPGSRIISLADGVLQPGESCRISVDVVGVTSGNIASLSGPIRSSFSEGQAVASGFSTAVLQVIDPEDLANLSLTKSFPDGPISPGAEGILRFTLTNQSRSQTFTDLAFSDDLNAMLPGTRAVTLPEIGGFAVDADFDGLGNSVLGTRWDFLDRLENENGRNDDYPVDALGRDWTEEGFDLATSTVGPWEQGEAPLQGGEISGFPVGTPQVLGGIDEAPNGENLVTTYLFRQKFTLSPEQAAITAWSMVSLFDDAAIVYLNGEEVFRSAEMPDGPVTPTTLTGLGNENEALTTLLDLTGRIRAGENTIAVEVHQNTLTSSDVGFSLALGPAGEGETRGFVYQDDVFEGSNDPDFSSGTYEAEGGFAGGALAVVTGGKGFFSFFNPESSGGWRRTFSIDSPGVYPVTFRYRLLLAQDYDGDEFSQALFELDGTRYGDGPNNSLVQFTGGVGGDQDSGWRVFNREIFLTEGDHTILLGVYNNKSSGATELTRVWFDEIRIGTPRSPAPICGPDSSIVGDQTLVFSGGVLAPGESCSFEVGIRVPLTAAPGPYLNRTSLVSTRFGGEELVGFPAEEFLVVETVPPSFQAFFSPADLTISGTGTLTFTIDNGGSLLEARALSFTATLPEGVVVNDLTPPTSSCGGTLVAVTGQRMISFEGGSLPPGGRGLVTVGVSGAEAGDFVLGGVKLSSSLGESEIEEAPVSVSPPPPLALTFAAREVEAGTSVRLTLAIDNSGSKLEAANLQVGFSLPDGMVLASPANPLSTCVGGVFSAIPGSNSFSYQGGTVPAGRVCSVSVNVVAREGGDYLLRSNNLVSALGNSGTAEASLTVASLVSVGLSVTESSATVVAGSGPGNLSYTVAARNDGPSRATGIEVGLAQILPAGVTVEQVTALTGTFVENRWSIPELASGQVTTLALSLTVGRGALPGEDAVSSGASLLAVDQEDADRTDDDAFERTTVSNVFDLSLAVSESLDPVIAGAGPGNLEYVVSATNAGPSDARGVRIATLLNLPEGVVIDRVESREGVFFPGDVPGGDWGLALPVGATESLTVVLTVGTAAPDGGLIQFSGEISEANGVDLVAGNDRVTEETRILAAVDLQVSAVGPAQPVVAGSGERNLVLTFLLTNAGPLDATDLELTGLFDLGEGVGLETLVPSAGVVAGEVWRLEFLGANDSATLTAFLTAGSSAGVAEVGATGTFTVTSVDQRQINEGDESASATAEITREVDLGFTLTGSRDPVLAGFQWPQNLFHTLTISNQGPSDASGVLVDLQQAFPEGVVIDGRSLAPGTGLNDSVWSVGDLAAGQSRSLITYFGVPDTVAGGEDLIATMAMVSGANEALVLQDDDQITLATDVVSPAATAMVAGAIELDLQTGLSKQRVSVTNTNPVAIPAFRLLVSGLGEGVTLYNAHGTFEGVPYIIVNRPLRAGESLDLTLEYLQLDASGGLEPEWKMALLDAIAESPAREGVTVDHPVVLPTGDVLIEFPSVIGEAYVIQYSDDGLLWREVLPRVVAGGTRQQWIDNGPPKTASPPGMTKTRFYRVRRLGLGN